MPGPLRVFQNPSSDIQHPYIEFHDGTQPIGGFDQYGTPYGQLNVADRVPVADSPVETSIVTLLNAGHGFTAPAPSHGANTDDTSTYLFGSQSLRLTTLGDGVSQTARKVGLTSTDMTGKMFRVTFMVDQPAHIANLRFDCSSDAGGFTNWFKGQFVNSNATFVADPLLAPMTWYQMTLPWGLFTTGGGTPLRTAIQSIQLLVIDDASGVPVNVWLDKVAIVNEPANAVITFTFDDGRDGVWNKAKPMFDTAGWRATWAPIVDKIGVTNYMTLAQNQGLLDAGWDPAVHAYLSSVHNNYPTVDDNSAIQDTLRARAWMRANGFGPADNFLIPKGGLTSQARDTAYRKAFTHVRTTYSAWRESWPSARPWNLRCYNPGTKAVGTVEGIIDEAVNNKEWLILQCHQIADVADGDTNTVLTADLQTYITYIQGKGAAVKVKTLSDVVKSGVS